ncbi:MAG: class I SAM-dependent methyltransferase [Phenylobacterium sp.]|uniref:class I SAM-dependent methyltransferase n=1 Tax=Phenylobacterium sp. TaxID=1871053 RepID=UPI0025F2FB99|nr:class I SAM-dependent methyltransferase [Phenylobacterium sp.]MCA3155894.1 class I SAM-dependent methyltransferase [Burkholderiales bacterium]MCA6298780.1 class I SAM-dependent methyltransferase [Phenylobacterium sp.]
MSEAPDLSAPAPVRALDGLTLVFPAGMPEAQRYRREAGAAAAGLLGASSLPNDPHAKDYTDWVHLPFVHDPSFPTELAKVISSKGVTRIWTCHPAVAQVLKAWLPKAAAQVDLVEARSYQALIEEYRWRIDSAGTANGQDWFWLEDGRPRPSAIQSAGLNRLVDTVPGMTDLDKISALIEIMRYAPPGDIVEIGSLWGRSATLLLLLGRMNGVGPVLCIDPWAAEHWVQGVEVLDKAIPDQDPEAFLKIFEVNLAPLANGDLNYLRAPSGEALGVYESGATVSTPTFGDTRYRGEISVLHIDGNHAFEAVELDSRLWTPKVRRGGWIIFDDYIWPFGDGPRKVGDAFLKAAEERIALSFVMGKSLFVKLA